MDLNMEDKNFKKSVHKNRYFVSGYLYYMAEKSQDFSMWHH